MVGSLKQVLELRIRAARQRSGFTQEELASQVARTPESISNLGYPYVCQALVRLDAMRRKVRHGHPIWANRVQPVLNPVIQAIATGARTLVIDTTPRLVIFGFDADQRNGALATILDRLEQEFGTTVYAVGNPKSSKTTPAFQPSRAVLEAHATVMADEAVEAAKPPTAPTAGRDHRAGRCSRRRVPIVRPAGR